MKGTAFFFLIFLSLASLAAEDLVFAMGVPEDNPNFVRMKRLCRELEDRTGGLTISLVSMPFIRSKREMLLGNIDGDAGRTLAAYEGEEGVLFLEPPVFRQRFLYYVRGDLNIGNASELEGLRLTAVRGNAAVASFIENKNWTALEAPDNETAFRQILFGRADFLIAVEQDKLILEGETFKDSGIVTLEEPAFIADIYIVISARHRSLLPRINRALGELAEEGRLEAILLRGE